MTDWTSVYLAAIDGLIVPFFDQFNVGVLVAAAVATGVALMALAWFRE